MPGENVDGTAFASDSEGHLGRHLPTRRSQVTDNLLHEPRVVGVEETVQGFAVPIEPNWQPRAKRLCHGIELVHGASAAEAAFDAGHALP